jgi:hypothetical protein
LIVGFTLFRQCQKVTSACILLKSDMMKNLCLLVLSCLLLKTAAASDGDLSKTFVGWSGKDSIGLSGVPQQMSATWTARTSWNDLMNVGWPGSNTTLLAFIKANPNGAVDFATGIIPHDLPSAQWNGLLDEVVAGEHDDVFVAEGKTMAKYGPKNVYCRPWWEMTINVTNLNPAKFQAAWNHAIPIIRKSFAATAPTKTLKIAYCYLPDAQGDPQTYFPGPKNVDVIDADIYGKVWGKTTPTQDAMLAAVQKDLVYLAAFAAAQNKPAGVSEWGNFSVRTQGVTTCQGRGDDPQYIDLMLSFGAQNHFVYMCYFNIVNGGTETLDTTPLSLAAFRAALTSAQTSSASSVKAAASSSQTSSTSTQTATSTATKTTASSPQTATSAVTQNAASTQTSASSAQTDTATATAVAAPSAASPQGTTTFAGWQATYFTQAELADPAVSGPTADPYGSGIPNLLAYALQLDPATAMPSDVPQPAPKNGHLAMSYQVPATLTDVDFVPEVSSDLQTWNSSSAAVQVVSNTVGANGTTVTVEDCMPSTSRTHFMRLRVTQLQ